MLVTETEPTIIMTGRQVELDLAGLLACESVVSETTQDDVNEAGGSVRFRSVSEVGSINEDNESGAKGMDIAIAAILAALESIDGMSHDVENASSTIHDVENASSTISSLTMPSLLDQAPNATMSTVSSLTTESANPSSRATHRGAVKDRNAREINLGDETFIHFETATV